MDKVIGTDPSFILLEVGHQQFQPIYGDLNDEVHAQRVGEQWITMALNIVTFKNQQFKYHFRLPQTDGYHGFDKSSEKKGLQISNHRIGQAIQLRDYKQVVLQTS